MFTKCKLLALLDGRTHEDDMYLESSPQRIAPFYDGRIFWRKNILIFWTDGFLDGRFQKKFWTDCQKSS